MAKLAFISTILGYPWGGADAMWTASAEAALKRGDEVFLATSALVASHPRVTAMVKAGAKLYVRRQPKRLSTFARLRNSAVLRLSSSDPLANAVLQFAPDLVIFSCGGTYDTIFEKRITDRLSADEIPFRIIANWQTDRPAVGGVDREMARTALNAAAKVFFLSERNLSATRCHLSDGLPHAKSLHIPLRSSVADDVPRPAVGRFAFAAIARLEPVKGLDLLLQALQRGLGSSKDWTLGVFGVGPELEALKRSAVYLGIGDRVTFHGFVSDLREIWANHHLFLSPALDEGVPMTIPEAMFHQRPALATLVGGAAEWIDHDETGFLCAAPTPELLSECLVHAWSRRNDWEAMGEKARTSATAHYRPNDYLAVIS